MSFKSRLGYLVVARKELLARLAGLDSNLVELFSEHYVLSTDELEYEKFFEGWKSVIIDKCKSHFIKEVIFDLDYSKDEMLSLFGSFESELELFDKWWTLENTDCFQIPTDWMET